MSILDALVNESGQRGSNSSHAGPGSLLRYNEDGDLKIDNNGTERSLRGGHGGTTWLR